MFDCRSLFSHIFTQYIYATASTEYGSPNILGYFFSSYEHINKWILYYKICAHFIGFSANIHRSPGAFSSFLLWMLYLTSIDKLQPTQVFQSEACLRIVTRYSIADRLFNAIWEPVTLTSLAFRCGFCIITFNENFWIILCGRIIVENWCQQLLAKKQSKASKVNIESIRRIRRGNSHFSTFNCLFNEVFCHIVWCVEIWITFKTEVFPV